jgi:trimethylamine--corrinoid protein Co-methyltransferase
VALELGFIEMGKRYYHLPSRSITYSSDSVNTDVQAAIESYEQTMGNILANGDYQLSEIGTLEGLMTTSYEKTILDEEITSRLLDMRKGIDVSDDAASLETIKEVGSGGTFLMSDDTLEHMRDDWYPKYTDWDPTPETRDNKDYTWVLRRANAEWKRRLAEAPDCMLDAGTVKELDGYIKKQSK